MADFADTCCKMPSSATSFAIDNNDRTSPQLRKRRFRDRNRYEYCSFRLSGNILSQVSHRSRSSASTPHTSTSSSHAERRRTELVAITGEYRTPLLHHAIPHAGTHPSRGQKHSMELSLITKSLQPGVSHGRSYRMVWLAWRPWQSLGLAKAAKSHCVG